MDEKEKQNNRKRLSLLVLGSAFGSIAGYYSYNLLRYLRKVMDQPRLLSRASFIPLEDTVTVESRAMQIAIENLRAGLELRQLADGSQKLVLNAGPRNFREPWARDLGFASYGLMALDERRAIRENLDVFYMNQLPDGQLPIKVHSTNVPTRYLHSLLKREQPIYNPLRPRYFSGHKTISLDGNPLLVIAALEYIRNCQDQEFMDRYWSAIKQAVRWLEKYALTEDGLLHQGPFSDWADSIARRGRVLYTNVLYWKALQELSKAAGELGELPEAQELQEKADHIKAAINDYFWRPQLGYYVTTQEFANLSSSGNLLAVAWDLATPEQGHAILDAMERFGMANPVPTRPVHSPYPKRYIAIENRLGGIGYYHTEAAWIWLGAWHVIAAQHLGRNEEARQLLDRMARAIVRDGEVHEVYSPSGRYISTLVYTSEAPLTWSAAMFVYASSLLGVQPA
jgi:GH15 family glucan-1,4-alpha-glucosidase